jgi:hypothetical protein
MNWEGEAPAEPKRQRVANSEWRVANSEWFFWRARLLPCRKNSVVLEHDPPVKAKTAANGEQRVASSFVWQCPCIAENFGLTTALRTSHPNWAHQKVRPPKNLSANREVGKSASRETAAIGE